MAISPHKVSALLELVRRVYPDWQSFAHEQFQKDEPAYKRKTVAKAHDLLSEVEFRRLVDENEFEEIIRRLDVIGKSTNLLYRSVPLQGDLNVLYQKELDKASAAHVMLDLLYGPGLSSERLDRYTEFVEANKLPNRWTFPTFFLFTCHPETDLFVKPMTITWYVQFIGLANRLPPKPDGAFYGQLVDNAHQLLESLEPYGAQDMVDVQSLIWVARRGADREEQGLPTLITSQRRTEFARLFQEFAETYATQAVGQQHLAHYQEGREQARDNYAGIVRASEAGEDITDAVLLKLLPYNDNVSNRRQGAWIHVAPTITGDLKKWFESKRWTRPEDWPGVAQAILRFLRRCIEHPDDLAAACAEFAGSQYAKGFQAGMLSPALNALRADDFVILNNKSRQIVNHFTGAKHGQTLQEYPASNAAAKALLRELENTMQEIWPSSAPPSDQLDAFSHWLVAVKKYNFADVDVGYWKIAPGDSAWNWEECRTEGFIAIGWDELGDLTNITRSEFERRRDEVLPTQPDWTVEGLEQVWKFSQIREGDRIVANRGTTEVLGVGTVTGTYYFEPGVRHGHRLPVTWNDVTPRRVAEGGWRRTLIPINRTKFDAIAQAPPIDNDLSKPFPRIFKDVDEAEWAFDFLDQTLVSLGVSGPDDQRFCLTLPAYPEADAFLTLNFGNWQILSFWGNNRHNTKLSLTLIGDQPEIEPDIRRNPFQQQINGESANIYWLPEKLVRPLTSALSEAWEHTLTVIARHMQSRERSPYRKHHVPELATAVFDREQRAAVFTKGLVQRDDISVGPVIEEITDTEDNTTHQPDYPIETCAQDTGLDAALLERWLRALRRKGQAIVYGPPGTGKTFVADHLARHLVGGSDGFVDLVQFHPSYAYEDFIQGLRPEALTSGGLRYHLQPGSFLTFCRRAERRQGPCVLIVDEINRANLSQVLGELMYLLEYRDRDVKLAAGGMLHIPKNVLVIGTMNTADRSIALVDHALRRRFAFFALYPNFDILRRYHARTGFLVEGLIAVLEKLNRQIGDPHYEVGTSFFLLDDLGVEIEDIWRMEIEPYLEEYFFDKASAVDDFRWDKVRDRILA